MAQIPPTPHLPSRLDGWDMENESLVMDQEPIFGDESMMEMTFEMSRTEDEHPLTGLDVADESTETIQANYPSSAMGLDEGEDDVEVAREAEKPLDENDGLLAGQTIIEAFSYQIDQDDYYGDYPPSPFLNRSVRVSKRANDPKSPVSKTHRDSIASPVRPQIDISFNQADVVSPGPLSPTLDGRMLEETSHMARGDSPTVLDRRCSLSRQSTRSLEPRSAPSESDAKTMVEGTGCRSGSESNKRPASSPRRASEGKKPKVFLPSQGDSRSRRLPSSVSSISTEAPPHVSQRSEIAVPEISRASLSFTQNAIAGPSRSSSQSNSFRIGASPPIHGSIPPTSVSAADEDVDTAPIRPSFLSRLIARSSILHPVLPALKKDVPAAPKSSRPSIGRIPLQEPEATTPTFNDSVDNSVYEVELARSRCASVSSSSHLIWNLAGGQPENRSDVFSMGNLFGHSLSPGSERRDIEPLPTSPGDVSVRSEILITSPRRSTFSPYSDAQLDQSRSSMQSRQSHLRVKSHLDQSGFMVISHSLDTSSSTPFDSAHHSKTSDQALSISSMSSLSKISSATKVTEIASSLRRSTSQRVIGFFTGLLSTSTSSRSSEQVHTSDTGLSMTNESELSEKELSLEQHDGGQNVEDVEYQAEDELGYEDRNRRLDDTGYQYPISHSHTSLPPPPRYIPLTRPNKAPISHTASRAANPVRRPRPIPAKPKSAGSSSFASAALARLPPPGKGCSSAGEKTVVKPLERATNLQARRALFEKSKNQPIFPTIPGKENGSARVGSDKGIASRIEEKKRLRELEERKRRIEEDKAYRNKRKETVVKARPVPDMYRRKLQ